MKALKAILAAALLALSLGAGAAGRTTATQKLVSEYARKEPLRSGILGVLAVRGADTLAQYNRGLKMVPASNVKLITTGLSLMRLGPSWRFGTTLAYSGNLNGGTLEGDLYIVGGGDPTLGAGSGCADTLGNSFAQWKALLDAVGIKTVTGRVIGDSRFFKRPSQGLSWQAEDLGYNYGAGPAGLNFFENSQTFKVLPGAQGEAPSITVMYPDTPWMNYVNSAVTGAAKTSNTLYYLNTEFGPFGEFQGSFPVDRKSYVLECSNAFGAYTCAYFFYNYLLNNGVMVKGGFGDISPLGNVRSDLLFSDVGVQAAAPETLVPLGAAKSPELKDIVKDTNFRSDNFYAETMFNMLSGSLYGNYDRDLSAKAEEELLGKMGLRTANACNLVDGSGLSRKNYVTPEFFVRFLRKMYAGSVRDAYLASLPTPGSKSTLQNRLKGADSNLKARIKMKSGSMNGVLCFSGYILPADGKGQPVVFSILTNNVSGPSSAVGKIIDEILLSLASEQ